MASPSLSRVGAAPFLYPLIDTGAAAARGLDPVAIAAHCLAGGARLLQLRAKELPGGAFLELARRLVPLAAAAGAAVVINDRPDIARLSGAAGVHVGQDDLSVADARALLGPDAIIGLSTHDEAQVDDGFAAHPSYIAVGPIFGTRTKDTGYSARGLALVRYAAGRGIPVVAIGGITLDRAAAVIDAGASGLAVITDLLGEDEPERRVRRFVEAIGAAGRGAGPA